ncbi:MAG: nitrate reductase molybdenum cofactor assembly chaperone [Terriglobia bacterium]
MPVYSLMAGILDYPAAEIITAVETCASQMVTDCPEAAALLRNFQSSIAGMSLSKLQEVYTSTFDLRPDSTPSLGYHLFGDDVRRSLFMAKLKERIEAGGIALGCELPDHLPLVLRLVDRQGPGEESSILMTECLVPALSRIVQAMGANGNEMASANVYRYAIEALLVYVRKDASEAAPAGQK